MLISVVLEYKSFYKFLGIENNNNWLKHGRAMHALYQKEISTLRL